MCKMYPTYKKTNKKKTGKWTRKRQYVSSGNTNAGLFFSERYIFLDAIFRRCESILNILRRNWATKEQKHSQCFPKLKFLKWIWDLNSLISLIRMGWWGNLFEYKKKTSWTALEKKSNGSCNSRTISEITFISKFDEVRKSLYCFPYFEGPSTLLYVCKRKLN